MHAASVPDAKTVKKMTAESYGHPLNAADIGPFVVPSTEYERILKHFSESELDASAWPGDIEMGSIRVVLRGGSSVRYCWFWLGKKGRLSFSCGGVRYRSIGERFADDETMSLDALVREIHSGSGAKRE